MTRPTMATRLAQLDLAVAALVTLAAFLATLGTLPPIVRLPPVVALVVFVPGYALLNALIVTPGLSALERVLIAVGASISLTVVTRLAMGMAGLPLDAVNGVGALTLVSLVGIALAWMRRAMSGVAGPRLALPGLAPRQAAIVVIAALLFADVVLASRPIAGDQLGAPPAQLWMIPGEEATTARLGMRAGPDGGRYVIRVSSAGNVLREYDVTLERSGVWYALLEIDPEDRRRPVVARLYEAGSDVELRYVVLQPQTSVDGS